MLPVEDLRGVTHVVTHDDCTDGTASAMILHDALPAAELTFMAYGTGPHARLPARPGMLFCDFSPPAARAREFVDAGAIVLDHHATARRVVAAFGDRGSFADRTSDPGVSGALLAFDHVWRPLRGGARHEAFTRELAALVGVRDTWQTSDSRWQAACAVHEILTLVPRRQLLGRELAEIAGDWREKYGWLGEVLVEHRRRGAARALLSGFRFQTPSGLRVVAVNAPEHASDVEAAAAGSGDVVAAFGLAVRDGRRGMRVSLRSDGSVDVGAIAEALGGGGHRTAAGFWVDLEAGDSDPYRVLERVLRAG